ncbi:MAG TPA: VOC family protein [Stellaceae bacterium]|jgi:catechol-2,3-dioxygenase|nr:VOC family protein [Stellaceae bacterium]
MAPPSKLAHIVLQTNRIGDMQDWYCKVLSARVIHDGRPFISFISYDEEHHRIAFLDPGPLSEREPGAGSAAAAGREAGLHHVAFTFASMGDLLDNYMRLQAMGIAPFWCVNHGPTTSMYYRDPDRNQVELQIDNFPTVEEGRAYMETPAFHKNPVGVAFDPEALNARFRAGASLEELTLID